MLTVSIAASVDTPGIVIGSFESLGTMTVVVDSVRSPDERATDTVDSVDKPDKLEVNAVDSAE